MIYFLASIPRSGSTLLSSLLSQRPDTYVSPTSNLSAILGGTLTAIEEHPSTVASKSSDEEKYMILNSIIKAKYSDHNESFIFDKSRSWSHPTIMENMRKAQGSTPKVIATVRPIAECVASFYLISREDKDMPVEAWLKSQVAKELLNHMKDAYGGLRMGFEESPENFCLIEYDNLCNDPQKELDRISDFVGSEKIKYKPQIDQVDENDSAWDIKDLHTLGSTIKNTDPKALDVLGKKFFAYFQGGEFWNDKPEPTPIVYPIDIALEAAIHGDFKKSWNIIDQLEKDDPADDRSAFNRGWHLMQQGKLLEGHKYINRGRNEHVFGNEAISSKPLWDGKSKGTILLALECGLGDQIHGFRYAKEIKAMGNKVIIFCCPELVELFSDQFVCIQNEAVSGVHHDYHVQAMSAPLVLGHEYADVKGGSYLEKTANPIKGRVGICWSGQPKFEHQQHRLFPHELMFDTVKNLDCVSLQRDGGVEFKPEWMPQADVTDWTATRKSISECELVITSCTSIAHLAGAMGIETWIIIPILPYYLWALPSERTPYYNSVKLFRQEKYGWWEAPFIKMAKILNTKQPEQSKNFEYKLSYTLADPAFM